MIDKTKLDRLSLSYYLGHFRICPTREELPVYLKRDLIGLWSIETKTKINLSFSRSKFWDRENMSVFKTSDEAIDYFNMWLESI